ncbi:MAG: TIGR03118 family protein [Chitinophagales bacterium]|nr:TIGR03118 family protein [Chitinophagales bacterium]
MKTNKNLPVKRITGKLTIPIKGAFIILLLFMVNAGCQKSSSILPATADEGIADMKVSGSNNFKQINLVADVDEYHPMRIDKNLVNAWGIAFGATGTIWISSADAGVSVVYDADGNEVIPPVDVLFKGKKSAPTGVVYNNTSDFVIPSTGEVSKFIFATEDGNIAAWSSGDSTVTVADESDEGAVYKGIAMATNNGASYIYATDFHNAEINVYDDHFNYVEKKGFIDPNIPSGYAPFNIRNIGGQLYVTYAKQLPPDNEDDEAGPGHGYIDIFSLNGNLIKRFTSQGPLNSPWGITRVPNQDLIFVGNFGDGKINMFDILGNFIGPLMSGGSPLVIDGLWALSFPQNVSGSQKQRLYFTAGPDEESHGLFGYLTNK